MAKEEKKEDSVLIRIPKGTLKKIEAKGEYPDKTPGGIVSRLVDKLTELEKSCPAAVATPPKKKEVAPEEKKEETSSEPSEGSVEKKDTETKTED